MLMTSYDAGQEIQQSQSKNVQHGSTSPNAADAQVNAPTRRFTL
jgi:hypothetical protein